MFDPNSFETELRDQPITVEIGRCYPACDGSDVEPPTPAECEFTVYGGAGPMALSWAEECMIYDLTIEHLKYASEERKR